MKTLSSSDFIPRHMDMIADPDHFGSQVMIWHDQDYEPEYDHYNPTLFRYNNSSPESPTGNDTGEFFPELTPAQWAAHLDDVLHTFPKLFEDAEYHDSSEGELRDGIRNGSVKSAMLLNELLDAEYSSTPHAHLFEALEDVYSLLGIAVERGSGQYMEWIIAAIPADWHTPGKIFFDKKFFHNPEFFAELEWQNVELTALVEGMVYGFTIEDAYGENVESMGGFVGDIDDSNILDEIHNALDNIEEPELHFDRETVITARTVSDAMYSNINDAVQSRNSFNELIHYNLVTVDREAAEDFLREYRVDTLYMDAADLQKKTINLLFQQLIRHGQASLQFKYNMEKEYNV